MFVCLYSIFHLFNLFIYLFIHSRIHSFIYLFTFIYLFVCYSSLLFVNHSCDLHTVTSPYAVLTMKCIVRHVEKATLARLSSAAQFCIMSIGRQRQKD